MNKPKPVYALPKEKGAATPPSSLWERPVWTPPKPAEVRPGANDFLKIKSKGA